MAAGRRNFLPASTRHGPGVCLLIVAPIHAGEEGALCASQRHCGTARAVKTPATSVIWRTVRATTVVPLNIFSKGKEQVGRCCMHWTMTNDARSPDDLTTTFML